MRIFLDANVLFSAAVSDGAVRRLLSDLTRCGHVCVVTGDRKHFGPLFGRTVSGIVIHSPRSLAESVWGEGRP